MHLVRYSCLSCPRTRVPFCLTRLHPPSVDVHEHSRLPENITCGEMVGDATGSDVAKEQAEQQPLFHEWASALPGMIAISRKKRATNFRSYVAAETACPVIVSSACLKLGNEKDYYFSGIVRSKSVCVPNDGHGASVDEYFTLSIGGMATVLNNSMADIFPGDMVEWTFLSDTTNKTAQSNNKRAKTQGPRRIGIKSCDDNNPSTQVVGRALTYGKKGESIDILIRAC